MPQPPDIFWPDEDDDSDIWFPADFLDDDATDDDIETLHDIQRMVGKSVQEIIEPFDDIIKSGRAGTVRGVRFGSGSEALLWLFRRGIFLYSSLVKFGDGSWGVAIGESERPLTGGQEEATENDIPF